MSPSASRHPSVPRAAVLLSAVLGLWAATVVPAAADTPDRSGPRDDVIVLPGATSAEGIARGSGATFYAGDLFAGDIFRGDLREGTAERFIDAPEGRMAVGMSVARRHGLLFVAGGPVPAALGGPGGPGAAYVYDLRTGATVASYELGEPGASFVNDVTTTRDGAWFTDSLQPKLYFVPLDRHGDPGTPRTLQLSGPVAVQTGDFDLNGIAAARHGQVLIVAHSGLGQLFTVDPRTGASALVEGVSVPAVDGLVYEDGHVWAVQNELNQVSRIDLDRDLRSGEVQEVITDEDFQTPTTAIRYRGQLAVVNAKFDTGIPPTAEQYEVVLVDD